MTLLVPCNGCPLIHPVQGVRPHCDLKAEKQTLLRGIGLTTAAFRCTRQAKALRAGRRVSVVIPYAVKGQSYGYSGELSALHCKAVILHPSGTHKSRWVVALPPDVVARDDVMLRNERGIVSVGKRNITLLDEPDASETEMAEIKARDAVFETDSMEA